MTNNNHEEQNNHQASGLTTDMETARIAYMQEAEEEAQAPSQRSRVRKRDRLKAMFSNPVGEPLHEDFPIVITYLDGITGQETHTSGMVSSWSQAGTLADKTMRQTNGTLISIKPFVKE